MDGFGSHRPIDLRRKNARAGRHILIVDSDLYAYVGGGQSVYRRLIALHPNDTFYYFRHREAASVARPRNAIAIPFRILYRSLERDVPRTLRPFLNTYLDCRNFAASVTDCLGKVDFDVVDAPDYRQVALFMRVALETEGCRVGTVALALHGTLSQAWRHGWLTDGHGGLAVAELYMRERLQIRMADTRYGLSQDYADYWRRHAAVEINTIDPLTMIGQQQPVAPPTSADPPDLIYVGRREKWKGPDLFLDLAWWIDRAAYRRLLLIGPEGPNSVGIGSQDILQGIARQRGLSVELVGSLPPDALQRMFADRTLVMLPSRHDTFNLTALEALFSGCPTLVSDRAGVAHWLRQNVPALDWAIINVDCGRTAASQAEAILRRYDDHRTRLVEALQQRALRADLATLQPIYEPAARRDIDARQTVVDLAALFASLVRVGKPSRLTTTAHAGLSAATSLATRMAPYTPRWTRERARTLRQIARIMLRGRSVLAWDSKRSIEATLRRVTGLSPGTLVQIVAARHARSERQQMLHWEERTRSNRADKIAHLAKSIPVRLVDRARRFRELARLERRAGHDLVAVTYALRVMRWLGRDVHGDLPFVVATLEANDLSGEAAVATSMFGDTTDRDGTCLALMRDAFRRHQTMPPRPLAVLDDRRGSGEKRVAAIVSLYNAADKLPTLLAMLQRQSLAHHNALEVILVDSASPSGEREVFETFVTTHSLPVVYARSAERETIQAAWNRGIQLSRAPYLTFLGVDEGVHPDGLRQLADVLDTNPSVDWAMANSLVTEVDRHGIFAADVMPYDRSGFRQDLAYLETCYLSWVGGLYRRSIHDRFGWYDESFRAAGDTEFKSRVMPHIRSIHVPRVLGVFNNYPEARTTQNPRAEIEDLRAWYLWRTPAGMQYAFGHRSIADAENLFRDALNYRKSFCRHLSTDFDFALSVADHLAGRPDGPPWGRQAQQAMTQVLTTLRRIDLLPGAVGSGPAGLSAAHFVYRQVRSVRQMAARHAWLFALAQTPHYEIFNDNRYEQHWYSWSDS